MYFPVVRHHISDIRVDGSEYLTQCLRYLIPLYAEVGCIFPPASAGVVYLSLRRTSTVPRYSNLRQY